MKSNLRMIVVDDFLVVRKGIELILKSKLPNSYVCCLENYDQVIEKLKEEPFDLIFLDINMDGIEDSNIISEIKEIQNNIKVLVFSSHEESKYGLRYIKNGADGFLNKLCTDDKIVEAIETIFAKGYFYSKDLEQALKHRSKKSIDDLIEKLSDREFEVYNLMLKGYGSLEISNKLDIHMSTVSTLKSRLFAKLNVKNIVELLEFANNE